MDFPALVAQMDRPVLDHLGGTVRYASMFGVAVDVQGIFDAAYVRVDAGEAGLESSGPAVFFRLEDLPADFESDEPTITANGVEYRVRERQKDGQGGIHLLLHRAE